MSSTGILKVYNNGNYIDTLVKKRKQGFIPYETNSSIREYNEFKSMFKPFVNFSNHNGMLFDSKFAVINSEGKLLFKPFHQELVHYAEQVVYMLSLTTVKPLHQMGLPRSNGSMSQFRVSGEFLVGEKVIFIHVICNSFSIQDHNFNDINSLWQNLQRVQDYLERGFWVPVTLPDEYTLKESAEHFSKVK